MPAWPWSVGKEKTAIGMEDSFGFTGGMERGNKSRGMERWREDRGVDGGKKRAGWGGEEGLGEKRNQELYLMIGGKGLKVKNNTVTDNEKNITVKLTKVAKRRERWGEGYFSTRAVLYIYACKKMPQNFFY